MHLYSKLEIGKIRGVNMRLLFLCIFKSQPAAAADSSGESLFSLSERVESPGCSAKVDSGLRFSAQQQKRTSFWDFWSHMLCVQYTHSFLLLKWYYKGQVLAGKKTSEGRKSLLTYFLAERESDEHTVEGKRKLLSFMLHLINEGKHPLEV